MARIDVSCDDLRRSHLVLQLFKLSTRLGTEPAVQRVRCRLATPSQLQVTLLQTLAQVVLLVSLFVTARLTLATALQSIVQPRHASNSIIQVDGRSTTAEPLSIRLLVLTPTEHSPLKSPRQIHSMQQLEGRRTTTYRWPQVGERSIVLPSTRWATTIKTPSGKTAD